MNVLNFGSLNIDHVYSVEHLVRPGETLDSFDYQVSPGGKGSNQSFALARAGAPVAHAGKLGRDGAWLKEKLSADGVDTRFLEIVDGPSGHAIIQVDSNGENSIILHGGANKCITAEDAETVISEFSEGDYLLIQNEISAVPDIIECGARHGMKIVFNPAPMDSRVADYPLDRVSLFCLNEIEGAGLTGCEEPAGILDAMREQYPDAVTVLTLGEEGVRYLSAETRIDVVAERVEAVDTTAAGDTFIGYLLAGIVCGEDTEQVLRTACRAAAICVTRPGAADSIPYRKEL